MTSQPHARRFARHATFDRNQPYGAWWPCNRTLADQLDDLFSAWPPQAGRNVRVLYSPSRLGRPPSLGRSGRTPGEDRVLPCDGVRRTVTVIPPETAARASHDILTALAADRRVDTSRTEQAVWDIEGGHGERPISSGTSAHAAA